MAAAKYLSIIFGLALTMTGAPAMPGAPIANQLPHAAIWDVPFTANGRDLAIRGAFVTGSIVLINDVPQITRQLSTDPHHPCSQERRQEDSPSAKRCISHSGA